ncbi:MAG: TetR family transcriptional regulator [Spirochaetes bacterium]|nr:MAG: TetR family transcriptional regulator [Spirochaetota bacterium]
MSAQLGTRDAIIRKGAELIHARGFNATGLQQILEGAGVPKGSFYFYFKSKEEFGLAIIDHFAGVVGSLFTRSLDDGGIPPLARLAKLLDTYERLFIKSGCTLGCPIGNLSLEMSDSSERIRARLQAVIDSLIAHIGSCLEDARREGSLPAGTNTAETACMLFHGLEGAILHMKVSKSIEPIRLYRKYISSFLGAGAPGKNTSLRKTKGDR